MVIYFFPIEETLATKTKLMNLKLFCLFVLIHMTINSFSQEEKDITNLTKVTFLNPGISREARIGKLQSIYLQAFMNTSAYFSYSSTFGTDGGVYFDPALTAQYRYYYNAAKRASKEKRTEMNNLNYLGGVIETDFSKAALADEDVSEENRRPITKIGVVWGIQRNGIKRFSLDLNLGIGYVFGKGTRYNETTNTFDSSPVSRITSIGQLNLGFWLNKRK
jgi:hypothetical protein